MVVDWVFDYGNVVGTYVCLRAVMIRANSQSHGLLFPVMYDLFCETSSALCVYASSLDAWMR